MLQQKLKKLIQTLSQIEIVHDVRGLGLQMAIELRRDGAPAVEDADSCSFLVKGIDFPIAVYGHI